MTVRIGKMRLLDADPDLDARLAKLAAAQDVPTGKAPLARRIIENAVRRAEQTGDPRAWIHPVENGD